MDNIDLYQSPLDMALTLCSAIYQMADNAKSNKKNCQQVIQRVKVLQGLVVTLKAKEHGGTLSPAVENALKDLCSTLKSAKTLMAKFSRNNTFPGLRMSGSHDDQFSNVDERLIDNFQVLSGVFLIDQGKDPSTMRPLAYKPTSMPQQSTMPPMVCNQASMPQQSTMPPMVCNQASMPQQSTMPPMVCNQASMPQQSTMPSMMYSPTASMPQPCSMPPMACNQASMPQQSTMPPMVCNQASMPQPSSMPPMVCNQASMPQPSTMPSMMYSPTASMPQPSTMPSMMYSPTASMPQPTSMPSMMYNPTAYMPQTSTMPMYTPGTPYPSQSPMHTMAMPNSIPPLSSIPFPNSSMGTMAPMSLSTQTTSVPSYGFSLK